MVAWRQALTYLFGFGFLLTGVSAIPKGITGVVGGILLILSSLLLIPLSREFVLGVAEGRLAADLSTVGTTVIVALAVTGGIAGAYIAPTGGTPDQSAAPTTETPDPTAVTTATVTATEAPSSTPTPTPTPTPTSTPASDGPPTAWTGTIVDVTDGDTMDVRLPNGSIETVRLLGVDTPETSVGRVSPDEWEDIPDTTDGRDWLVNHGDDATSYAEERLEGQEVYIETDPEADRRGYYGRLLVYISQSETAETSFNGLLLQNGYARYYDSEFSEQAVYQDAESTAQQDDIGVWGYSVPETATDAPAGGSGSGSGVVVASIHEDADGNDNENLNDEYVTFENTGDEAVDLSGWTVSDEADHVYTFPNGFTLEAGAKVTLYTGSGTDTDTELYWGEDNAVWNNGGDTVIVEDDSDNVVDTYEY